MAGNTGSSGDAAYNPHPWDSNNHHPHLRNVHWMLYSCTLRSGNCVWDTSVRHNINNRGFDDSRVLHRQ